MYSVYQPAACNGHIMGYAMVSFSNDGTCWTAPTPLRRTGGPNGNCAGLGVDTVPVETLSDRKSTRLNSSHVEISYAVVCLKKKIIGIYAHYLWVSRRG